MPLAASDERRLAASQLVNAVRHHKPAAALAARQRHAEMIIRDAMAQAVPHLTRAQRKQLARELTSS